MKLTLSRGLLVALLCLVGAGSARADEYHTARVSDIKGNLSVRGEDEDDVSYVSRNAVIREGDTLWTDDGSHAELELPRSTWVRLAEESKVEVRRLYPTAEFRLWTGSAYFDAGPGSDPPRIITPVGDVEMEPDSLVRVDLSGDDSARVSVVHGRARVIPDRGDALRLRSEERTYLEPGRDAEDPKTFDARADRDTFDDYQHDRVEYIVSRPLPRDLEADIIGARDLRDYGTWVEVERVRYWRPRCEPDWRPYSTGYWSDVPGCGYTWIDYQPWGYTTCHYGRWMYQPAYGWLWAPRPVWAPAYVSWASSGGYYGWAPLDLYDRPCHYGSGSFVSVGIVFDNRSWTFCGQDSFFYGRHHQEYLGGRNPFRSGTQINFSVTNVHVVKNVYNEIGVPRQHVRGLAVNRDGRPARERVLALENKIPQSRQRRIEQKYQVRADRDIQLARRPSDVEGLQRNPGTKIDRTRIATGDEGIRVAHRNPTVGGDRGGNGPGRGNGDRPNTSVGDRPRDRDRPVQAGPGGNTPGRDNPRDTPRGNGDRPNAGTPGRDNPRDTPRGNGDRPNSGSGDRPANRDDRFRRGGDGGGNGGNGTPRDRTPDSPRGGDRTPTDRPRTDGDRPRTGGDRPRTDGDRPRTDGDRPRSEGDRPRTGGDRPRSEGDRPRTDGSGTPGNRDDRFRRGGDGNGNGGNGGNGGSRDRTPDSPRGGDRSPADRPRNESPSAPRNEAPRDRGTTDRPRNESPSAPRNETPRGGGTQDRPQGGSPSTAPRERSGDRPQGNPASPSTPRDRGTGDRPQGGSPSTTAPRDRGTDRTPDRTDRTDRTDRPRTN